MMVLGVSLLQFLLVTLVASQAMPGCQDKCGNFSIPYPFGIGEGCFREGFDLDCNRTEDGEFLPYLGGTDIYSRYMSFSAGEMGVTQYIAQHCYNKSDHKRTGYSLWGGPYTFSSTQNTFTVLGCDTDATIRKRGNLTEFLTGCYSVCENPNMVSNGSCNGIGCCQTSIPKGLKDFDIQIESYDNYSGVNGFSPCSYAFLADRNWFKFHGLSDFSGEFYDKHNGEAPLVLEWAIGNQTCEEARTAPNSDYACVSKNSYCYDSSNAPGYRCNCSSGYEGNPYLEGGCQDIDECKDKVAFPCSGICTNKQGSYNCECPKGKHSVDPKVYKCKSQFPIVPVAVGIGIPLLLILIGSWIYLGIQTRELNILKEKYYQKNGGKHLEQLLAANPNVAFKIFSKEELLMATDKFDEKNILGQGGQGMVFKGVLSDNRVVAIKKSIVSDDDEMQNKQFANEIFILSQVNHKNVVKLLGYCAEVEVPMLVYEYISNGSLFNLIHREGRLCLSECLRIATEAASALAYLHWDAFPPILHGDVKSSNILLDKNLMTKVSDFGTSKLTPKDTDQFATFVQGTRGYLDPEYFQRGILTDRSDVYSFGVILLELLARKTAVFRQGNKEINLANVVLSSMKEDRLVDVLDHQVVNEGRMDLIIEVCKLAKRCVNIAGEERPTMKEVAMELAGLTVFYNQTVVQNHPWVVNIPEETETLHDGESSDCYTSESRAVLSIDAGR